jgi:hypothetical protein
MGEEIAGRKVKEVRVPLLGNPAPYFDASATSFFSFRRGIPCWT